MRVLVTGAAGFVGRALLDRLRRERRHTVRAVVRAGAQTSTLGDVDIRDIDITPEVRWHSALTDVDAVVHLSGRVHVMRDRSTYPLEEFRRANVGSTLNLARQAAESGVRRFVYLSSVKVHGESGRFSEADAPAPQDPYGISKHEAECHLTTLRAETKMQVVVIRPPLVYGPAARGNFASLVRAVAVGLPLPLGGIGNRRSLVGIDNLCDFIVRCLDHVSAANETFLVSDGDDLSTTELVQRLARAMGRDARLVAVPPKFLATAATLIGRRETVRRLVESLQVDISKARRELAWSPPVSVEEGLHRAVAARPA
jgi:nucleoside-diphosphate-sugar epimerase